MPSHLSLLRRQSSVYCRQLIQTMDGKNTKVRKRVKCSGPVFSSVAHYIRCSNWGIVAVAHAAKLPSRMRRRASVTNRR